MMQWVDVAAVRDIASGERHVFRVQNEAIIILNVSGNYYAVKDICSHDGGELSEGELVGTELICPRHGAHFCIKTGDALTPPAYEPIPTYPIRVQDDKIQIQIDLT